LHAKVVEEVYSFDVEVDNSLVYSALTVADIDTSPPVPRKDAEAVT